MELTQVDRVQGRVDENHALVKAQGATPRQVEREVHVGGLDYFHRRKAESAPALAVDKATLC